MKNETLKMKSSLLKFLEDIGISYPYLINGFVGALIWSIYKKLRFVDAVRQMFIGSVVAGYVTPLIAHREGIALEYIAALSFIIGMTGLVIVDSIYKFIANKVRQFSKGKEALMKETSDETNP